MDAKKKEELLVLQRFKTDSKLNFAILEFEEANKLFSAFNNENPDFIIKYNNKMIGVELFKLYLTKSNPPIEYAHKTYVNQEHKRAEHPDKFESLEELEIQLKKEVADLEAYPFIQEDDISNIIQERLTEKLKVLHLYVTNSIWLIGYANQLNQIGLVEDISRDNTKLALSKEISNLLNKYPQHKKRIENLYLFEYGTNTVSYTFEYNKSI
ncbi:MAG: hypothetical protein KAI43_13215 [Candidatus Aureabacteria bacterium]|nr:hypothetical protein [Candidatus Auribacterota bacterium]